MSKRIYQERFQNVLRVLDEVEQFQKPFVMEDWISNIKIIETIEGLPVAESCGTAACAIGWCTFDPWFNDQGFWLNNNTPEYQGEDGWEAVKEFFGMKELGEITYNLFEGCEYTPDYWYDTHDEMYFPAVQEVRSRIQKYMTKRFGKSLEAV